ncbi:MAG: tetratricopeptide repeat protein [Treponema sp.]|jgi:tetratricopeptide (TPR) repeat protein|nr:tetratricopeptide repeat protein [Treponema sp.]
MANKLVPGAGEGNSALPGAPGGGRLEEGIRLFRLRRWDLALKELLRIDPVNSDPEENRELAYYLGLCYTKLGRFEDALLYLEQVIAAGRDMLRVYQCRMTLAYIYVLTKRSKMAEFELQRLQNSGIESPQIYTTLAYAAWLQKRWKNAVGFYERALELDGNNTTAMNGLGYILADTSEDLIRGLRLCRRAVDRKPQNAAYLDSLGWAYYKSGEIVEARIWTRRALEIAPGEKEIREHWQILSGDQPGRRRG